jgi:hypothetical protein
VKQSECVGANGAPRTTSVHTVLSQHAMHARPLTHIAVCIVSLAVLGGCDGVSSTTVSNGVLSAELPGKWTEEVDPAGQRLIAAGPIDGERLEATVLCRAGHSPSMMGRSDLEIHLRDELGVQLTDVRWSQRAGRVVATTESRQEDTGRRVHYQMSTHGNCFVAGKYENSGHGVEAEFGRAQLVLDALHFNRVPP